MLGRSVLDVQPAEHQPLVLAVEGVLAAGGMEDQGVALEQAGELLLADPAAALAAGPRMALGGDEPGPARGLGQFGVHQVDVGLLGGQLGG